MKISNPNQVSFDELTRAVKIAARVVFLYGDVYLPLFTRLHTELEKAKENIDAREAAIQLAKKYIGEEDLKKS